MPRLQHLKSQPPGGKYNTAKVSKSPSTVDMYKSPSKEHKTKPPSKLHVSRTILSNTSPKTDTLVKVDHASKWHEFESIVTMSPLPELILALHRSLSTR